MEDPIKTQLWTRSMSNELGRISPGFSNQKGTDTIQWMMHENIGTIPKDRTFKYARIIVDYIEKNKDPNRVRITAGGNLIYYLYELTTQTADLIETKIMWNSVSSTKGEKYMCIDIKNMYLATPMDRFEYIRIPMNLIPKELATQYNLHDKVKNGFVYIKIEKKACTAYHKLVYLPISYYKNILLHTAITKCHTRRDCGSISTDPYN